MVNNGSLVFLYHSNSAAVFCSFPEYLQSGIEDYLALNSSGFVIVMKIMQDINHYHRFKLYYVHFVLHGTVIDVI